MPYDTDELTKMSRRRFTDALVSMGLSGAVVHHMSQEALADHTDDPSDEVPRLFGWREKNAEERRDTRPSPENRPEMEEVWYTIPRSKWVRVETAQNAAQKLGSQMDELDSTNLIKVAVTSEYDRPKSEKRLVVKSLLLKRETLMVNGRKSVARMSHLVESRKKLRTP